MGIPDATLTQMITAAVTQESIAMIFLTVPPLGLNTRTGQNRIVLRMLSKLLEAVGLPCGPAKMLALLVEQLGIRPFSDHAGLPPASGGQT
jgi:hypothetical protein